MTKQDGMVLLGLRHARTYESSSPSTLAIEEIRDVNSGPLSTWMVTKYVGHSVYPGPRHVIAPVYQAGFAPVLDSDRST